MLGKEPKILNDNPLPSSEKVEEFQQHIKKLEVEKFHRLEKFLIVKEELLKIVNELNMASSSQFEKKVLSADDSLFLFTEENMNQLDLLRKNFFKDQKNVKEEIVHLRNKIDEYWIHLKVDLKERDFRQKHTGNSLDVLHALKLEIQRCNILKKAFIEKFIDQLRNELEQLWTKCNQVFGFFKSEDIMRISYYYKNYKELLTLLEKHECLWNKMLELEQNSIGPNRYNNRGAQLLKEEKERNKLSKQIPQIENTLYSLADKYKQHHNVSFTTRGISILDYLANLDEERENAKKQKLSARKMQREQTYMNNLHICIYHR